MKPNLEDDYLRDYLRPRDPVEFVAGYIILLIVALIAFAPIYMNDRENVTVAAKAEPADAKRAEATSTAARDVAPRTESF